MDFWHVSQLLDGRAGVEHRSRPNILTPFVQFRQTNVGQTPIKEVRALVKLANRLTIVSPSNIMTAQHKLTRLVEIDSLEERQSGYESGAVDQTPAHRGHSHGHGRSHSAQGANQPQTHTPFTHKFAKPSI